MRIFDRYLQRIAKNKVPNYVQPRFNLESATEEEQSNAFRFEQLLLKLQHLKPETWFIYSSAGSGKTSLIWELMHELLVADEATACIRINKINIGRYKLGDEVHEFIKSLCPNTVDSDLWKSRSRKNKAKIVIFIDAINEIYANYKNTDQWQFILNLLQGNHRFCVLATSRYKLDDLSNDERDIEFLSIQPLRNHEIERYLRANNLPVKQTLDHISAAGLSGTANNPFLLTLITRFAQTEESKNHSDWPHSRAELLQKTWTTKLSQQHIDAGLSDQALLSCVALISFVLDRSNKYIPLNNVTTLLGKVWKGQENLVAEAKNHLTNHHLVKIHNNAYQLIHDSLIELGLAQLFIAKDSNQIPLIALKSDKLDTFIGDWVALHNDPDKAALMAKELAWESFSIELLIDIIVADSGILSEETLVELWQAVGYGLSGNRTVSDNVASQLQLLPINVVKQGLRCGLLDGWKKRNPWIAEKINNSLHSGNLSVGYITKLKRQYNREYKDIHKSKKKIKKPAINQKSQKYKLINQLMDSNKSLYDRRVSALRLSEINTDSEVTSLLLKTLLEEAEHSIRGACANALGNIGDKGAVETLAKALLEDKGSDVRGSCANALGNIGDKGAVEALAKTLLEDEGSGVRGSCATALGNIGDKGAVETLAKALLEDKGSDVRGSCANALGNIGDKGAVEALAKTLLEDEGSGVRGSCATALGNIGDKGAVEALAKALLEDNDSYTRGSCATALGNIGDKGAVEALAKALLEDKGSDVRGSCAAALGKLSVNSNKCNLALEKAFFSSHETDRTRSSIAIAYTRLNGQLDEKFYNYNHKRRSDGTFPNKKLQGKIVELVANNNPNEKARIWLNKVARKDFDYRNRTMAVIGLDKANKLNKALVRYIIDPTVINSLGKPRDTDNGVLSVTADAVIRRYIYSGDNDDYLLKLVLDLFLEKETHSTVFIPTFISIREMPLQQATDLLRIFDEHINDTKQANTFFCEKVEKEKQFLEHRKQVANELDKLKNSPASYLKIYKDNALPEIEKYLPKENTLPSTKKPKIAVITVTDTESTTFLDFISEQGYPIKLENFKNRFGHLITIKQNNGTELRFIRVQPTDKGSYAALSLVNDILDEFNPTNIIMVGICAGFPERGATLGDVIIAQQVFNYERSRLIDGDYRTQAQSYRCSPYLINLSKALNTERVFEKYLADNNKIHFKDYACGDKVIADKDSSIREKILAISDDIVALEMEGSGMLHSIWENIDGNTVNVAMIKAVSDLADKDMRDNKAEKQQLAMKAAIGVTMTLLRNLGE